MKTLQSALKKSPELLETLFNHRNRLGQIMCNIKIDAVCLIMEVDSDSNINYYTRAKQPLDLIKRTGVGIYEGAIKYLESKQLYLIPPNTEIHLEIFPKVLDESLDFGTKKYQPSLIDYGDFMDQDGTSGIILSLVKNNDQMLVNSKHISNILEVDAQPLAELTNEIDTNLLSKMLDKDYDTDADFTAEFFVGLFNRVVYKETVVPVEGFVVHDVVSNESYKIINPVFKKAHTAKTLAFKKSSYCKYSEFMVDQVFDEIDKNSSYIKTKKILHRDNYLDFVTVTSILVYEGIKNEVDEYISQFNVNFRQRPTRLDYSRLEENFANSMDSNPGLEDVFRIILFNFKQLKKRCSAVITLDRKRLVNSIIQITEMS